MNTVEIEQVNNTVEVKPLFCVVVAELIPVKTIQQGVLLNMPIEGVEPVADD